VQLSGAGRNHDRTTYGISTKGKALALTTVTEVSQLGRLKNVALNLYQSALQSHWQALLQQ
jgi:hypothetical protein